MPQVSYGDGTVLIGNDLSPENVVNLLQPTVCMLLGITPPDYNRVRVEWTQAGQPGFGINDDIAFIRVVDDNAEYSKQRDDQLIVVNGATVEEITYITTWRAYFDFYGPNCYLRASTLISGLLLSIGHDALAAVGLYMAPKVDRPVYLKEQRDAQWWPRASFSATFNYQVTNRIEVPTALSAEVRLYDPRGLENDIKIPPVAAPPAWPSAS